MLKCHCIFQFQPLKNILVSLLLIVKAAAHVKAVLHFSSSRFALHPKFRGADLTPAISYYFRQNIVHQFATLPKYSSPIPAFRFQVFTNYFFLLLFDAASQSLFWSVTLLKLTHLNCLSVLQLFTLSSSFYSLLIPYPSLRGKKNLPQFPPIPNQQVSELIKRVRKKGIFSILIRLVSLFRGKRGWYHYSGEQFFENYWGLDRGGRVTANHQKLPPNSLKETKNVKKYTKIQNNRS